MSIREAPPLSLRHLLSWKSLFYDALLPALGRLPPARADAIIDNLGRAVAAAWPPRRQALAAAIERARTLGLAPDPTALHTALAGNIPRYLARDYPLDRLDDATALARFDVRGRKALEETLAAGRGAILVGSHFGAHLAGLHWLHRRAIPTRLLIQRPRHVSSYLVRHFDAPGPHPQSTFFLRRKLPPGESAARLLRALSALRDGLCIYLTGDIPWTGPNARTGHLLGRDRPVLAVWADLAAIARVPVHILTCTHRPAGRYALTIEPIGPVRSGDEDRAVARYLTGLDAEIAAQPAEAVAHLLWPCYA